MRWRMAECLSRVANSELTGLRQGVGAVLIRGRKACSKTATVRQIAGKLCDFGQPLQGCLCSSWSVSCQGGGEFRSRFCMQLRLPRNGSG